MAPFLLTVCLIFVVVLSFSSRSKDYRKVPIATWRDETYFGSNVIIEQLLQHSDTMMKLEDRWQDRSMSMEAFQQSKSAHDWSKFAQDELAVLLYPNMCRTWSASYQAFGYVKNVSSFGLLQKAAIRSLGSLAMYMAASKIKSEYTVGKNLDCLVSCLHHHYYYAFTQSSLCPLHSLQTERRNISDERAALDEILVQLEGVGLQNQKFLSGMDEPDLGDLAVFGTLRSLEGLPVHQQIVEERGSGPIPDWYRRMTGKVRKE